MNWYTLDTLILRAKRTHKGLCAWRILPTPYGLNSDHWCIDTGATQKEYREKLGAGRWSHCIIVTAKGEVLGLGEVTTTQE